MRLLVCLLFVVGCGGNVGQSVFVVEDADGAVDATSDVDDASYAPDTFETGINGDPCQGNYACCPGQCGVNQKLTGPPGTAGGNGYTLQ
jgi:hypothetical protein